MVLHCLLPQYPDYCVHDLAVIVSVGSMQPAVVPSRIVPCCYAVADLITMDCMTQIGVYGLAGSALPLDNGLYCRFIVLQLTCSCAVPCACIAIVPLLVLLDISGCRSCDVFSHVFFWFNSSNYYQLLYLGSNDFYHHLGSASDAAQYSTNLHGCWDGCVDDDSVCNRLTPLQLWLFVSLYCCMPGPVIACVVPVAWLGLRCTGCYLLLCSVIDCIAAFNVVVGLLYWLDQPENIMDG